MADLHPDNADIIREGLALGIFTNVFQDPAEKPVRGQTGVTNNGRAQPVLIKERAGRVFDFEEPVREKHDEITFLHRPDGGRVNRGGKNARRRAARILSVELLGRCPALPDVERARMPCIGKTQLRPSHIGHNIETGGEHGGAGLFQDYSESAVDAGEQFTRIAGQPGMFLHQAADHSGDKRGAHPVPHHVADEDTGRFFADRKEIVAAIQEVHSGKKTARTWRFVDEQQLASVRKEHGNEAV